MINWISVAPAIQAWFTYGLNLDLVVYENAPRPYTVPVWGHISLEDEIVVGTDSVRYKTLGNGNQEPWILGLRQLVFSVQVESDSQDADAWSRNAMSRMMTTSQLPLQHDRLSAVDVSLIDVVQSSKADYEVDNRMISACVAQVRFYAAVNFRVEDVDALGSWIQSVGITPHMKTEAGVEVPLPAEAEIITTEES